MIEEIQEKLVLEIAEKQWGAVDCINSYMQLGT